MSRSDLARELNLTRTTVGNAVRVLLDADLVHEPTVAPESANSNDPGRTGRPSVGIALNAAGAYFVGLNISTTALTAVLLDFTMSVVATFTCSVGPDLQDVAAVTDRLATLANRAIRAAGKKRDRVRGIGISVPGLVTRSGRVAIAPFLQWRDVDLKAHMIKRLGLQISVKVCNDAVALASAVCATASETEVSDMLLILMSEGIGSASIRQGRVHEGFNGFAGEIGQTVLDRQIARSSPYTFQLLAGERFFVPFLAKNRPIVDAIIELAGDIIGHPDLAEALEQWAAYLAAGFLNAIWMLDPERIVIGGSLAPLYVHVAARVDVLLGESMGGLRVPPIMVSAYGAEGAAVGAAALIREALFTLPELADSPNESDTTPTSHLVRF